MNRSESAVGFRPKPWRGGTAGSHPVVRVVQRAGVQRQTAAADATGEPVPQPLQPVDAGIELVAPALRQLRPVRSARSVIVRQGPQRVRDVLQAQSHALGGADERQSSQHASLVTSLVAARARRPDQPAVFVEPKCRGRYSTAFGEFTDGQLGGGFRHSASITSTAVGVVDYANSVGCVSIRSRRWVRRPGTRPFRERVGWSRATSRRTGLRIRQSSFGRTCPGTRGCASRGE